MANPTTVTQYQTAVAPELAPYVQQMLGVQAGRTYQYQTDADGNPVLDSNGLPKITGFQPAPMYTGERNAAYSDLQNTAYGAAKGLKANQASTSAAAGLESLAQQAGALGYSPSEFGSQFNAPAAYDPGTFTQQNVVAPSLQNYQMAQPANVSAQQVGTPTMQAAQTDYNPALQNYQMGPAQQVRTQSFARPGTADAYMSPYMQSVVDIQKREAQRASDIAGQAEQAQAVGRGAFGGSRDALVRAERARNLATQMGDIQATGQQAAYQQAQQQFNAEQQARLSAQQANQQAGLTVGQQNLAANLGIQQLGVQTGLQTSLANLNNQQQAAVQNQAAQLQAQGLNAQQALQAALANQQAGLTTGQQNLAAQLGIQQLGAGQQLTAQQLNQANNLATQQAQQQANQYGYGQGMTAAQLQAQYGLAAQQAAEQSKQFGTNVNLQGLQTGLSGYSQLGAQGQNLYGQNVGNITLQNQLGTQQQQNAQNILNTGYQNWLYQQQYPQQQMDTLQSYIRGTPLSTTGSVTTQSAPSTISQIAGLGTAAAGAYGMYNNLTKTPGSKKGGVIKSKQPKAGGLEALALSKLG